MNQKEVKIILSEGTPEEEIQLLRTTTIYDPRYGKVEITPLMLDEIVKNFDNKVRGVDLMIDYSHETDGEAAGWIKNLRLDESKNELWATVEWTKPGRIALEEKRYLYISADFEKSYRDNETLKNYGTVLKGAALTNRPVVKRMAPAITLSEVRMEELVKELMAMLKVENADEVKASMEKMMSEHKEMSEKLTEKETELEEKEVQMSEKETKLEKQVRELSEKLETKDKESKFNVMLSEGRVCEAQRDSYLKGDMNEFVKNAQAINLSEQGHGGKGDNEVEGELSHDDKVLKLAEEKLKAGEVKNIVEGQELAMKELNK